MTPPDSSDHSRPPESPAPLDGAHAKPDATLQGAIPSLATPAERNAAMDQAFDYRGDVTIEVADGRRIEGYVFDRRADGAEPVVRIMPKDSNERITICYRDIVRLTFSGRDPAAGKSWEAWLKKYREKKAAGAAANLESEPLE